jgi:hypothetical protein
MPSGLRSPGELGRVNVRAVLARLVSIILVLPVLAWAAAALWFDGPASRPVAGVLAAAFAVAALAVLLWPASRIRGIALSIVLVAGVAAWWVRLEPSNERSWQRDVAQLTSAEIQGDRVTLHNVRNFDYRSESDYTERWETRSYDLSEVVGADLYLCSWGSPWIAHTIVSWEFADGDHLAVSIETRKETHEAYSAVRGFFRQFELYYVVADERDVVRLRTNYRGDQCRLYRLSNPPEQARAVLLDYLEEINRLAEAPEWYNAATHNCTTTIRHHAQHVGAGNPWDWRVLVNGSIDQMGYERGTIDQSLPFAELRERSHINARAQAAGDAPDFSGRIRVGLPGAHGQTGAAAKDQP